MSGISKLGREWRIRESLQKRSHKIPMKLDITVGDAVTIEPRVDLINAGQLEARVVGQLVIGVPFYEL